MPIVYTTLLKMHPLREGSQSGIKTRTCRAIRNQSAWQKVWNDHCSDAMWTAPPIPPAVDFTSAMVIGVWHGVSNQSGPSVVIEDVEERLNSILVTYKITGKEKIDLSNPGNISAGAAVYTQPFNIVSVKRSSKRVLFKEVD